jgi:hypothetical protein
MTAAPREVRINAVLNGFSVKVGCQTLVFNSIEDLLRALQSYLFNPTETEKTFLSTARYDMPGALGPVSPAPAVAWDTDPTSFGQMSSFTTTDVANIASR